ncbi:hypothetical protein RRG08_050972 [Elysia crispata]|uniref:Uncharacterized protein n=1 Tax=Elysia crispata TaxID=231223 RepID=A0AAE0Y876_9GAST|nr:hypothetical protein RRG08_050972 [Elysia crispata]
MGLDEYDVKHNTSCRPAPNYRTPRNAKVSHATQCCSGMPRNGKSGMDSIKKNCFGDSSVGQRTSHEVIEPLEIGDQPATKKASCPKTSTYPRIRPDAQNRLQSHEVDKKPKNIYIAAN